MKRNSLSIVGLIALSFALAACSGTPSAPQSSAGGAGGSGGTGDASASAPTTTVDPAASCLSIDTTAPTVDGTTLGTCISDALHVIGTFRASSNLSGEQQKAEIRLRPDVALHGTNPHDEVIYVDGIAYKNSGDGWVKGDTGSSDPEEYITGAAGLMLVAVFAGDILKQSIAACPLWNIEVGSKKITLPSDLVVEARVFSCAAPFESLGTTVSPMDVWIGSDWTPYGYESTATGYGQTVSGTSYYYDHGKSLDIKAPM